MRNAFEKSQSSNLLHVDGRPTYPHHRVALSKRHNCQFLITMFIVMRFVHTHARTHARPHARTHTRTRTHTHTDTPIGLYRPIGPIYITDFSITRDSIIHVVNVLKM
jgi:hypothetical protein